MHTHIIIQGTRNIHAHTLCIYKHKFIDMKPALVLRYNTNRKFQQTAVLQSAVQHERRRSQMCYDLFIQHSGLISMQTLTALFLKFPLTLICSFITSPHAGAPTRPVTEWEWEWEWHNANESDIMRLAEAHWIQNSLYILNSVKPRDVTRSFGTSSTVNYAIITANDTNTPYD